MLAAAERLQALIQREVDSLAVLLVLLNEEHAALKVKDTDGVVSISERKRGQIELLEACAAEKAALLDEANFPTDKRGMTSYLARFPSPMRESLEQQWRVVEERLLNCQQQNQVNGLLLDATYRNTQKALSLLLGNASQSNTYNKQGAIQPSFGARTYAKV